MSDLAPGSSLLTEGGGTPNDDPQQQPAAAAAASANGQAAPNGQAPKTTPTGLRLEDLPEELRGSKSLARYAREDGTLDNAALAKSYVNLETLLGSEKVPLPKGDNDTEGWDRLYASLGRPESPDKYEVKKPVVPADIPLDYDEGEEKFWRELAHKNGLSAKQFGNMWDTGIKARMDKVIAWKQESVGAKAKAEDTLKREWGQNYEANLNVAKAAFRQYADPDFAQYLDETGLGNDPRFTRAYYKIGKAMGGTTRLQGAPKANVTGGDIDQQIMEYRTKFNAELMDGSHPSHDHHVRHLTRLFEARHGD